MVICIYVLHCIFNFGVPLFNGLAYHVCSCRYVSSELATDNIINVGEVKFYLHKVWFPCYTFPSSVLHFYIILADWIVSLYLPQKIASLSYLYEIGRALMLWWPYKTNYIFMATNIQIVLRGDNAILYTYKHVNKVKTV